MAKACDYLCRQCCSLTASVNLVKDQKFETTRVPQSLRILISYQSSRRKTTHYYSPNHCCDFFLFIHETLKLTIAMQDMLACYVFLSIKFH